MVQFFIKLEDAQSFASGFNVYDILFVPNLGMYFVDLTQTCINIWPNLYELIETTTQTKNPVK